MEIEKINETELAVKEYQNLRVVTFKDIDTVHGRPDGTARKRFNDNKKHFIEGEDFFKISVSEIRTHKIMDVSDKAREDMTFLTESGYLMLVKSFTDDLAWSVQRQLVKNYFRKEKPHSVKQLTITSRDIAKILYKPNQHGTILREIRDCIAELQEMGFNTLEFFQESQYLAGNNEHRPQFIVTERGCEFYSRRLEPEERQIFIAEFKDRFQRMQDVLDGKPVKGANREPSTALVSGAGTADIKLFSNGKMGLIVAGDKFYTIAADRLPFIEKAVTELLQSNVPRMDEIINSMFSASCKQWDYELVTSYSYAERTETPQIGQIDRKGINNPRQGKTPEIEQIDLNSVVTLTKEQAKARYNMGTANLRNLAEQIGALVCSGTSRKRILYNRKKLDEYFNNM